MQFSLDVLRSIYSNVCFTQSIKNIRSGLTNYFAVLFIFNITKIDDVSKKSSVEILSLSLWVHVIVCACRGSQSSVRVPRQQVGLGGEQLFVEGREQRVNSERVALTEPAQLLHVQAAQGAQHRHLLVQLVQRRRAHLVTGSSKVFLTVEHFLPCTALHWPWALDSLGCLSEECVWGPLPLFFGLAAPCLGPPSMVDLDTEATKETGLQVERSKDSS